MIAEEETTSQETTFSEQLRSRRKIGIAEAAEILGVKPATLYNWAKEGKLEHIQYGPHGRMLFFQDAVLKYLEEHIRHLRAENSPPRNQEQR